MAARDVRKNLNLFVDGQGYAGQIEDFNAPVLASKLEEFRGGGMDAPIDLKMGTEKLETSFNLIAYDKSVLALFGVANGSVVPFVAREALESFDGTVTAVVHTMRGRITKIDPGTSKSGDKAALQVALSLDYYKLQHGDTVVQEIDVANMIHKVNGVDVLAAQRVALAI
jgi:P2 family phage contractile tail tube protein